MKEKKILSRPKSTKCDRDDDGGDDEAASPN